MANWPRCCGFLPCKKTRRASIYTRHVQDLKHEERPSTAYVYLEKFKERAGSATMVATNGVNSKEQPVTQAAKPVNNYDNHHSNITGGSREHVTKDDEVVYRPRHGIRRNVISETSGNSDRGSDDNVDIHLRSTIPSILKYKKSPQDLKHDTLIPPAKSCIQVLLVASYMDTTFDSLKRASEKLGFDVTSCETGDALEEFQSKSHDLIFIDTRSPKLDYDTLCRSIRNTKGSQSVAIVAVTKKSDIEKEELIIPSLLDSGFNRCLIETTNVVQWMNELIQLKHGEVRLLSQQATTQALFAALDKCRDIVIITDDCCRMQYVNAAAENCFGYRYEELLGRTLSEQLAVDQLQIGIMTARLMRSRAWAGVLVMKRKTMENISVMCTAIPINCAAKTPTHYSFVIEPSTVSIDSAPRGSATTLKRNSIDVRSVGSDYTRRTSLAKLSALPLEAPITKIIHLIAQAQDSAGNNNQLVALLDKVIEMLRCTELYSPQMKSDSKTTSEEPVASDLIGALISSNQHLTNFASRRSSNDSSVYRVTSSKLPTSKIKMPTQVKDLLDTSLSWDFDIIRLEELSNKRPLLYLGMHIMLHFDVPGTLNIEERVLYNFLVLVESKYHADNSYHNSTHAADVMQAVAGYLERERLKSIMDPLDEAVSLIAAACHDVDHPGRSSAFLSNCDNPLAILYNDITVLENHHAALTFKLALGDDRVNIFKNLDRDTYKMARQNIVDMILATEMTKHFEHLAKFVNVFSVKTSMANEHDDVQGDYVPVALPENILLIKRMMIKCADVSNPTRPLGLCVEWARRITEEYFQQTDEEKAKNLPVLMPMFDRTTCSIPKAQIGFVDFIINDMVEAWNGFIDFPELVTYMRQNYLKWKEFDENGYTTLTDIRKLQMTVLSPNTTPTVAE